MARTIYYTVFGHRDFWDDLELRSRRKDCVLCPRGIPDSTALRDLSRSTAMQSSSFMETGPIMGWFTANIGYHHIHHLNARIPFYRLPEVLREIPELQDA